MKFPKNAPMNNKTGFRREFRAGFCRAFVLVANEISSERQVRWIKCLAASLRAERTTNTSSDCI